MSDNSSTQADSPDDSAGETVHHSNRTVDFQAVATVIERYVSKASTRRIGAIIAMAYGHLTDVLFLGLWAGSVYLFTYSIEFASFARNLALITITIGTFVLMAGSNLIDRFEGLAVNIRAYIHNSITFIASGIGFLLGSISHRIVVNYSFQEPLATIANAWLLALNIVASFLFLISVWVLLKLLWRLDRVLSHEDEFHKSQEVYGEFRDSIEGLTVDRGTETATADGRSTALGLLFTAIGILTLGGVPYVLSGTWVWSVGVLGVGYLAYAGLKVHRDEF